MAIGSTTAVLLGLSAASAGFGVSKMFSGTSKPLSMPTPLPQPPRPEETASKAEEIVRKKKAALTQSVYTSPLGVAGEANVARKTLLGQ